MFCESKTPFFVFVLLALKSFRNFIYFVADNLIHMKKILLLSLLLIGFTGSTFAQAYYNENGPNPKVSAGFGFGATVGPYSGAYPASGSLNLKFECPISDSKVNVIFTTGYTFFVSGDRYYNEAYTGEYDNNYYTYGSLVSFIPVETGIKAYVYNRIFIEGDVGASFNINSSSSDYTNKKVALIYSPSAGYSIPFGSTRFGVDLSLGYEDRLETGGGYSQIAFKAAFNFGL